MPIAGRCFAVSERTAMQVILKLVEHGADPNARGDASISAIEWAGSAGKLPALKMMLKLGADMSRTSKWIGWNTDPTADPVEKVDLVTRLKEAVNYVRYPEDVKTSIKFLQRFKSKKMTAADIESFDELIASASDDMAELRELAAQQKKKPLRKRKAKKRSR